jgi:hypothetical protein
VDGDSNRHILSALEETCNNAQKRLDLAGACGIATRSAPGPCTTRALPGRLQRYEESFSEKESFSMGRFPQGLCVNGSQHWLQWLVNKAPERLDTQIGLGPIDWRSPVHADD